MWKIVSLVCICWGLGMSGLQAQQTRVVNKKAFGLFQQARDAFREGKREKALELLAKAKVYEPGFSGLYLLEADIYHRQGEKAREMEAVKTALTIDSLQDHPYYFFVLAEEEFEQAHYDL